MKMKAIRMLGKLAMTAAVAMVVGACSSDDNLVDNGADNGSTAARSVTVTVGAGIADDAATRSAVVNGTDAQTGKPTHTLKFTAGDKLYVHCKINYNNYKSGMLTMVGEPTNDGKNATFSGEMTAYKKDIVFIENDDYDFGEDPLDGTTATLVHEGMKSTEESEEDADYYFNIDGGKIYFSKTYANDVETLMTKRLQVTGDYVSGSGYTLTAGAIFNCTFTGLEAETDYLLRLHYPVGNGYYSGTTYCEFTTDKNGTGTGAFTPVYTDNMSWEIDILKSNNTVGIIDLGTRAFEAGKIYNVSRHWTGTAFSKTIDLATIAHHLLVGSGMTLTGELKSKVKISIANGATVTLAGVTIDEEDSWEYNWAGLTCLGNANIVLNGENTVTTFSDDYPGIQAGPEGTKLTISGSGKLTAKGKNNGAGIGGGILNCGDITISGGTVTASSLSGAGIGSGYIGTCGAITITGCTVTATNNEKGAAIGCGEDGHCGDITIDKGKKNYINVKAETVDEAKPIGLSSHNSQCGKITIGGCNLYEPGDDYYYDIRSLDGFGLKVNESEDKVWYVKSF